MEEVAGRTEIDRLRLSPLVDEFVLQLLQGVLLENNLVFTRMRGVAPRVAVEAAVGAAGGQIDGRHVRQASKA